MLKLLVAISLIFFIYGCSTQKSTIKENVKKYTFVESSVQDSSRNALNTFINGSIEDAKGNYTAAINDYKQTLALDPKPGVYFALAKDYLYLNNLPLALQYSKKSIELDSSEIDYYDLLSEIFLSAKEYDSSAVALQKIINLDSSNINAYYRLARIYENNKPLSAINIYNKITSFIGPDWNVLMHIAELYASLGNFKDAANSIQKLLTIDPENAGLKKLLSEYYTRAKMYDDALKIIDDALTSNPDDIDAHQQKAQIYLAQNNWDAASKEFTYILNQPNISLESKIRIGASYFEKALKDSSLLPIAQKFFTKIDNDTTDWRVKLYLGDISAREKNDSSAINFYRSAIQLANWNVDCWVRLGGFYFDSKKYDSAASIMRQSLKMFPEDFRVNLILGLSLAQNNHNEEAKPYLKKAVDLNPKDITALSAYGYTLSQLKENDEAIFYLQKALSISPNDVNLLGTLGLIYDGEKKWTECDSVYEKALSIDSTNALINNNYAYSLSERGIKLDKAFKMAKTAITDEPVNSSYLDTMGWVYFKMGNYNEAKQYIEKAIKIDSSKPDVLEHLGDIEFKMGNKEKAKEAWQKALNFDKNNNALKQKLEKGES